MKITTALLSLLILPLASTVPFDSKRKRITDTSLYDQNDLSNGLPCKPLTVIYARGTNSPGNVGDQPGPQFFQAIADLVGLSNMAVQGVNYTASIIGFLSGGDADGSKNMSDLTVQAANQCPNTKIVVSGYSQGGQLVHNAAGMTAFKQVESQVSSVVIFGDPKNGTAVGDIPASKVLVICHSNDNICQGGIDTSGGHLTYSDNATEAAQFVASHAGL